MKAAGGNRPDAGARKVPARSRVPGWAPLVVLFSVAVWLVGRIGASSATSAVPGEDLVQAAEPATGTGDEPFGAVDPRYVRLDGYSGFVDDRWRPVLAARLAALPEAGADDPESLEIFREALSHLPFVAEVGVGSVLWPDGYKVAVRLRKPEACLRTAAGYFLVDAAGVVLPGEWKRPPWVAGGWLPVLGPLEDPPRGGDAALRPGGRIAERRHLDALSVAVSMRRALGAEEFEVLGAPVIDATEARAASVEKPGVVLELEEGRRVLFGRPPDAGEPGELPVGRKWAALAKAARALSPTVADRRDWSLLDVRWDVPDVLWREVQEEAPKLAAIPLPVAANPQPAPVATPTGPPKPATPITPASSTPAPNIVKPASPSVKPVEPAKLVDPARDPPTNKPRVL